MNYVVSWKDIMILGLILNSSLFLFFGLYNYGRVSYWKELYKKLKKEQRTATKTDSKEVK